MALRPAVTLRSCGAKVLALTIRSPHPIDAQSAFHPALMTGDTSGADV